MLIGMIVSGALLISAAILVVAGIRAAIVLWSGNDRNTSGRSTTRPQPVAPNADAYLSAGGSSARSEPPVAGVTTLKALQN